MYQDVKFIQGNLYYEEKDGRYYPIPLPRIRVVGGGGGGGRTAQIQAYGFVYHNSVDYNLPPTGSLVFDSIINNKNVILASVNEIQVQTSGKYEIEFVIQVNNLSTPGTNLYFQLFVNGNAVPDTIYSSSDFSEISGVAILNLSIHDKIKIVNVSADAAHLINNSGSNTVGVIINRLDL